MPVSDPLNPHITGKPDWKNERFLDIIKERFSADTPLLLVSWGLFRTLNTRTNVFMVVFIFPITLHLSLHLLHHHVYQPLHRLTGLSFIRRVDELHLTQFPSPMDQKRTASCFLFSPQFCEYGKRSKLAAVDLLSAVSSCSLRTANVLLRQCSCFLNDCWWICALIPLALAFTKCMQGFKDVIDVQGGFNSWVAHGKPTAKQ